MKNIKKLLSLTLLVPLLICVVSLVGCKKDNNENEDIQLDGVNVVLSLQEADQLLSQAKVQLSQSNEQVTQVKEVNAGALNSHNKYTKSDLLLIINQIKQNIVNSNQISGVTTYTMDGVLGYETCVVTQEEAYFYVRQGNEESETWYKNEDGTLYYYDIYNDEGMKYIKRTAEPFKNNNAVYDFCQGKFTFTCKTLTEDDIEKFVINKNKMYIKLNSTIFNGGDVNVTESFEVKDGRIIKDHLKWEGVDLVVEYKYDEYVDTSSLALPSNITWTTEN